MLQKHQSKKVLTSPGQHVEVSTQSSQPQSRDAAAVLQVLLSQLPSFSALGVVSLLGALMSAGACQLLAAHPWAGILGHMFSIEHPCA